jgi:protein-S-isoprenylcysteine O-methyltransferase Ste14
VTGSGRGGGWVVAQFAVIAVIVVALVAGPRWPGGARPALVAAGGALVLLGAGLAVWAARALGRSLTPFPRPVTAAELVETGPFSFVRHPIYSGGLLFFCGWSLVAGPVALVPTCLLAALWAAKSMVEERHLSARFPGYAGYMRRVRFRLVPGVF